VAVDQERQMRYTRSARQEPRTGSVSSLMGQLHSRPCSSGACLAADSEFDAGGYLFWWE